MSKIGNTAKHGNFPEFIGTGTGSTQTYTLSWTPGSPQALLVWVGGMRQQTANYAVLGNSLIINAPLGVQIMALGIGQKALVNSVADGAIGTDQLANGGVTPAKLSQALTLGTAQAATSGTSKDFTGIPSWVKRVTFNLSGVSTNGSDAPGFKLGTSSGIISSGYSGCGSVIVNGSASIVVVYASGFFVPGSSATNIYSGQVIFTLLDVTTNTWSCSGVLGMSSGPYMVITGGSVQLSGALTTVRLTTVNGTDTFDAGSVNIMYEG